MKCAENSEHLAAYLHDELTSADEDSFQLHLSVCLPCREKHAAARDVTLQLQRVVLLEPAASAREDLRQAIDAALRKSGQPGAPMRFRDGSEVRWRRPSNTGGTAALPGQMPRPFALPLRKPLALPPPAAPTSPLQDAASGLPANSLLNDNPAALSPTAREVSTRLNNITRRRLRKRVRGAYLLALGLTCLVAGGWLAWRTHSAATNAAGRIAVELPKVGRDEILSNSRWNERHAVSTVNNHQSFEALMVNKEADLAGIIGDATVHVLQQNDPRSGECCLVLFRDADRKTIAADEHRDVGVLDQELTRSVDVVPINGRVGLPPGWIDTCIGSESRIVVLKLDDRLEIWSDKRLRNYMNAGPVFDRSASVPAPTANALTYYK